ncbi:Uncharacterized protein TCM_029760 [Theobroma cacao]|uniref:Uncharacterized protein n=1 Tax=Theobroma cacao TaxID=3641 RepID=A0A061GET8_THECC|nr:Uncharacterized protein TCM_029760 [Theobroma cacao]
MCSNSVGGRAVASASGVGDRHDFASSSIRKAKKQRIPKRGPGVAELEKILREQEQKDGAGQIIGGISSSLLPSLPNTYPPPHSSFVSSSNPLPRNVTFLPDHNHLGNAPGTPSLPPVAALSGNINGNGYDNLEGSLQIGGGSVGGNGRSKGVYIGGSGVYLPEQTLLPITWGSTETRKGEEAPKMDADFSFPILVSKGSDRHNPPRMLQKTHSPCHPSMVNFFPRSAASSPSTPPSSSAGVYHHVEPPSNQKSCLNYTCILPEEDKVIGVKRPRPNFPVDKWLPAPPSLPYQLPHSHPHIPRLGPSMSSSNNHGVFNLETASRDPMPTSPLELEKVKSCVNDQGNPSGNGSAPITLGSPTTPLPSTQKCCQPDFSKFKQYPFQDRKESSDVLFQRSSGSEGSVHKRRFFTFLLQPEEQRDAAEATPSFQNEKCEKTGDLIDLTLKL